MRASLSTAQSKNRKFALTQAKLLAKLEDQQQISSAPSGDKARIDQLERALGDSQAKLAKRDKDFEDIVAKMNRILDRLHTNQFLLARRFNHLIFSVIWAGRFGTRRRLNRIWFDSFR